jgi:hypothetical protein
MPNIKWKMENEKRCSHLEKLPPHQQVEDVQTINPVELIAGKVVAYHQRRDKPKAFTDRRDLAVLLLLRNATDAYAKEKRDE